MITAEGTTEPVEVITGLQALMEDLPMAQIAITILRRINHQNGQAIRIFVKFLQEHPERLHEPESWLMMSALEEAFPCENLDVDQWEKLVLDVASSVIDRPATTERLRVLLTL